VKFPLVICSNNTLEVVASDFFEGIGELDMENGTLELNVLRSGTTGLNWILDADGIVYDLSLIGMLPRSLFQRIGLSRAREQFRILPGLTMTAQELRSRISGLRNKFEQAPNVTLLRKFLATLAPDHVLGRGEMASYLGE